MQDFQRRACLGKDKSFHPEDVTSVACRLGLNNPTWPSYCNLLWKRTPWRVVRHHGVGWRRGPDAPASSLREEAPRITTCIRRNPQEASITPPPLWHSRGASPSPPKWH